MAKYLLAVHMSEEAQSQPMTEEDIRRGFAKIEAVEQEMKSSDALRFTGRLLEPKLARVVRPLRTRMKVTDGPFAETKEHLGGFYIIEADNMGAALQWATKVATAINAPIEVRPFFDDPRESRRSSQ